MTRLAIRGAKVFTQDEARRVVDADVRVEDGVITEIGDAGGRVDETIDAAGKWLLPGLVNAHTHLPMVLFRGYGDDLPLEEWLETRIWPAEARMTEQDMRVGTRLAALEMILGGSTTFNDMYFFEQAIAQEADRAGLRGIAGWGMVDVGKVQGEDEANPRLPEIARFVEAWKDHPRIRGAPAPHGVYTCTAATYRASADLARRFDTIVHTHAHETRTEVYGVQRDKGHRPIGFLAHHGVLDDRTLLAHCGWVTKAEVDVVARAGAGVAHCPVSNFKLATGGTCPVPEFRAAGAAVGLGTDGAASNNTMDLFETMKFAALAQKQHRWDARVLPAQEVLDLATRDGARALRLFDRVGSIEVGKRADLVLVDPDTPRLTPAHDAVSHLVYAARPGDVWATIVDGRVLKRGDDVRTLNVDRVLDEARRAAGRLTTAPSS